MTRIITITRGNQYDSDGYSITNGTLWGWGSYGPRMDGTTGITYNGEAWLLTHDRPEVETAIAATIRDGLTRTITIPDTKSSVVTVDDGSIQESGPGMCPKCHSYCYGDCEVN